MLVLLGVVVKDASRSEDSDEGDPTDVLKERAVPGLFLAVAVAVASATSRGGRRCRGWGNGRLRRLTTFVIDKCQAV